MAGVKASGVFSLLLFIFTVNINGDVIVNTADGKVAGVEVKSILPNEMFYSFMGIPYGKPPVKELQYMAPEPHPGWEDVLEAKKERKPCFQLNFPIRRIKNYGTTGEEDCLHLSVHTPKLPDGKDLDLPVIVHLYNEQFKLTFNGSKDYGPDFFMKEDVLFVTISYRVGSFGFLSFEDDLLPGNNGLRDVILALKWIQLNIHNFGGDPYKITLMGSDGGAAIADLLMYSPKAKGLFHGVILQSGTSWNSMYLNVKGRNNAENLAKTLDISSVSSAILKNELTRLNPHEIAEADWQSIDTDEARAKQASAIPFGPIIEHDHPDAVLTRRPEDGPINIDIPIMIGYNSREGLEMSERILRKPQYLTFVDRDFLVMFPIRVDFKFKLNNNIYRKVIEELKEFYFEEGYVKVSKAGEYLTYISDVLSFYSIDYTVRKYVNESSAPVYYYTFDFSGELNLRKQIAMENSMTMDGTWGATTGDELCYLFVCKQIRKAYKKILADEESEEFTLIRNMVKLWSNFAKTGNPTPPGDQVTWTPASKENKECLVINEELQMRNNLHEDRVQFWDEFLRKYEAMAVNGVINDVKDEL